MANVNATFKNKQHGELHAIITHGEIWYSGKDICRILNLPSEEVIQKLVRNENQTEYTNFKEDWSIESRDILVDTSGMFELLKHGQNEAVSNWFDFFVDDISESLIEQLESFENDDCKINILYEG